MIITIEGTRGEGKSTLAEQIIGQELVYNFQPHEVNSPFPFHSITKKHKFILIEEVSESEIESIKSLFNNNCLEVDMPFRESYKIKTPHVIIIKRSK